MDKKIATQANALIRANQGELTLTEKRIMLFLISHIKPEDEAFKYYRIHVSEFASMLPNNGNNETLACMNACDGLEDKKISVDFGDHITKTRLVLKSKYYVGLGYFDVLLDDELKPLLLQLKDHFSSIYIRNALSLTSVNAVRFYEIAKSWESTGKLITTPDKLKEMMGLEGKYEKFSQFKANCLKPIFSQLKELTDIEVRQMKERKRGRRVEEITIFFGSKKKNPKNKLNKQEEKLVEVIDDPPWKKEAMKRGVAVYPKYEEEGLTADHWVKALQTEGLEGGKLVSEARKIRDQEKYQDQEKKKKDQMDKIIKTNKAWWEEHQHEYENISSTSAYLQHGKGKVIKWTENLPEALKKYKKQEVIEEPVGEQRKESRRTQKSYLTGTSDRRKKKTDRRN
jgi:plasmid replication initiation protein